MSLDVDIRKRYDDFELDVQLQAGSERVALLGASGCGKSLTLRCIAGVETPDEGRIVVDGITFFDSCAGVNLSPQERACALLFQNYQLFPHMTAEENVCAGMRDARRGWGMRGPAHDARCRARSFLQIFGVAELAERYPAQMSGGQQQRVALARMLAAGPQILMFDEPFSALDSYLKSALEQTLLDVFSVIDRNVLYVSHDIDEACRLCDRICVMHNGRIEESGTAHELLARPQTLAGMRLTGCKNTSRARRVSATEVEALDWGMTFDVGREVPSDVAYVGVRARHIHRDRERRVGERGRNSFDVRVARVSDSRFERLVLLDPPLGDARSRIQWKVDMVDVSRDELPHEGETLRLHFDASKILLVSR